MSSVVGNVYMVVAPSGAGKSSLVNALLEQDDSLWLSVSCTTRPPRSGEVDGKDYRFVTHADFDALRHNDRLLEWAHVHGNYYGTPRDPIDAALVRGQDVLLEIDWQGARHRHQAVYRRVWPQLAALRTHGLRWPQLLIRKLLSGRAPLLALWSISFGAGSYRLR